MKNSAYILDGDESSLSLVGPSETTNRLHRIEKLPMDENLFRSIRFVNGGTTSDLGI
jgi:hypothetical protein